MTPQFSNILNACRWLAAWLVLLAHARHLTFIAYRDVTDRALWVKGFYFLTGLGHEAVLVFFVISGLLVGGLTLQRSTAAFDLRAYALSRVSRIYSVLVLALVLGWMLDSVGLNFFNRTELYTNSAQYHTSSMDFVISTRLDAATFLGNLLSLQTIFVTPLGSNGPLWSLAYEWWYYIIFGAVATLCYSRGIAPRVLACVALLVAVCIPSAELLLWGLIWVLGVGVYLYGTSRLPKPPRWLGLAVFAVALVATRLSHSSEGPAASDPLVVKFSIDFAFAASFAFFLLSFWGSEGAAPGARLHEWLASFSFSTYLIHFPIYVFLSAVAHDVFGIAITQQPGAPALAYMAAAVACVLVCAYGFSLVTEKRTGQLKAFLSKRWAVAHA